MTGYPALKGRRPWGDNPSVGEQEKEAAPRQDIVYHCDPDCARSPFTVPFAAEAKAPDTWDCKCGRVALRDGAPEDTPRQVELPGLRSGGGMPKHTHAADVTPRAQLFKRRKLTELEEILAERLAEIRGTA